MKIIGNTVGTTIPKPNLMQTDPAKGDFVKGKEELDKKLDADKLPEAVNAALAQAKESGQFDGQDGKTPVKGEDYFTPEDKADMVSSVLAALPTWTGGSY